MERRFSFYKFLAALALALLPALMQGRASEPSPGLFRQSPNLKVTRAAGWQLIRRGTELRTVTLERANPYQQFQLKMVRFNTRWMLPRIVASREYHLKTASIKTVADKSGAVAMINANYFDPEGRALGFLKAKSVELNPNISQSSLFTGIFGVKNRIPFITHRDRFSPGQADEAVQAGPLLLLDGESVPITRAASRQSRRALIGIDREQKLLIAVTDNLGGGLTWQEVQEFFGSDRWQAGLKDLLNLDGGGSAQLYVKGITIEEHIPGGTEVPVMLGFFAR